MRMAILGAGAIGGFLAVRLAEAGFEVSVLARGAHLAAIRERGLRLIATNGDVSVTHPTATDDPAALGAQDCYITSLKAPALPGVLSALPSSALRDVPVITAMNGVFWWYGHDFAPQGQVLDTSRLDPSGALSRLIDPDRAIGMVIQSTNEVVRPGVVQNRSKSNRFLIGAAAAAGAERVQALVSRLAVPGVSFEAVAEIRRNMWHKLLRNLTTAPASVLTAAKAHDIINDPHASGVARALFLEGAAVAEAHGFTGLAGEVDEVFRPGGGAMQKPSMRQDLEFGRPMEIDTMLRIVQDFARQASISVPVLDIVVSLVMLRARVAGCYGDEVQRIG